jgi:hypothetical protein
MVILVRRRDGICTIALESCLNELISDGLVSAFLSDGEWVATGQPAAPRDYPAATPFRERCPAPALF